MAADEFRLGPDASSPFTSFAAGSQPGHRSGHGRLDCVRRLSHPQRPDDEYLAMDRFGLAAGDGGHQRAAHSGLRERRGRPPLSLVPGKPPLFEPHPAAALVGRNLGPRRPEHAGAAPPRPPGPPVPGLFAATGIAWPFTPSRRVREMACTACFVAVCPAPPL